MNYNRLYGQIKIDHELHGQITKRNTAWERNGAVVYIVTFAGHRETYQSEVKGKVDAILDGIPILR